MPSRTCAFSACSLFSSLKRSQEAFADLLGIRDIIPVFAHSDARLMLAVKIAATGDQQPMISGEFRIIAIMPLFMIIAEGLDAVDAGIDRFLQRSSRS